MEAPTFLVLLFLSLVLVIDSGFFRFDFCLDQSFEMPTCSSHLTVLNRDRRETLSFVGARLTPLPPPHPLPLSPRCSPSTCLYCARCMWGWDWGLLPLPLVCACGAGGSIVCPLWLYVTSHFVRQQYFSTMRRFQIQPC